MRDQGGLELALEMKKRKRERKSDNNWLFFEHLILKCTILLHASIKIGVTGAGYF